MPFQLLRVAVSSKAKPLSNANNYIRERFINKLTKLGRCDRYTIEGLIIGLLGLLGL